MLAYFMCRRFFDVYVSPHPRAWFRSQQHKHHVKHRVSQVSFDAAASPLVYKNESHETRFRHNVDSLKDATARDNNAKADERKKTFDNCKSLNTCFRLVNLLPRASRFAQKYSHPDDA